MLVRIVIMFVAPANITLTIIVLILFVLFTAIFWISSSVLVYQLIDKTEAVYGAKKVFSIILFPLGEFYIGNYLAQSLRNDMRAHEAI